jgi:membrane protease YdiL (CAAX protease family)
MFNRYWRDYPWPLQLLLFVLMIFILAGFFMKVVAPGAMSLFTDVRSFDLQAITPESPMAEIRAALTWQALSSIAIFLLPSLLFAYQTTPHMGSYLGLRRPGKKLHWGLVTLLMLGAMPLMLQLQAWMRMANLGTETHQQLTEALLRMQTFGDFAGVFFVMAILPALGEELFFRGVVLRFLARRNNLLPQRPGLRQGSRMLMPIGISALMFAILHSSVYGFPSILMAGVLLGLIYYLTGSLWCCILAHLLNNGLQIILVYLSQGTPALKKAAETDQLPWLVVLMAMVLFIFALRRLWQERTPLPPDWTADYLPDEPIP